MKVSLIKILLVCMTITLSKSYVMVKDHNDLYMNTFYKNYALAVMHNANKYPTLTKPVHKLISEIENYQNTKDENIIVHLIYTDDVTFFDKSYKLKGKNGLFFFIRNQLVVMEDFNELMIDASKESSLFTHLVNQIKTFLTDNIAKISIGISTIDQFDNLINEKKILGFYTGENGKNFKRYIHVARKNIDFPFVHTFDQALAAQIFKIYTPDPFSSEDMFVIFRHSDLITEFDSDPAVVFKNFNEKQLTEFFEYERYPKLRNTDYANMNTKKMFFKYQAVLLFVYGEQKELSREFLEFKNAVMYLPKNMIYGYMDQDSNEVASYTQMFMMGGISSFGDGVFIMYVGPTKDVSIKSLDQPVTAANIVRFVNEFMRDEKEMLESMKEHLYDKEDPANEPEMKSEEL